MKLIVQKAISFLMAFVILLSTMSFTINTHYCGDNLVDTAIFKKAKGCGMEMQSSSIEGCVITKKNCCSDKQIVIEGQDDLKLTFDKLTFKNQQFVISLAHSYISLFKGYDKEITSFQEYKPPLVVRQIYKIDETYLI